jgi:hypothetical protein
VAQRFNAAITGLFAVPASQAAEKLTEGQPPSAVQRAKLAETQAGRARPKAEFKTISYSDEFPCHPKSGERSVTHMPIRLAKARDVLLLSELIAASVRGLQAADYSAAQLESALRTVYGVDTQLISDGTYFAAEETQSSGAPLLVVAADGANEGLCMAAISLRGGRIRCWIRQQTRLRFERSLCIQRGRGAGLAG